jgi:hypothetical protein
LGGGELIGCGGQKNSATEFANAGWVFKMTNLNIFSAIPQSNCT